MLQIISERKITLRWYNVQTSRPTDIQTERRSWKETCLRSHKWQADCHRHQSPTVFQCELVGDEQNSVTADPTETPSQHQHHHQYHGITLPLAPQSTVIILGIIISTCSRQIPSFEAGYWNLKEVNSEIDYQMISLTFLNVNRLKKRLRYFLLSDPLWSY